jgi:hypothetical protein
MERAGGRRVTFRTFDFGGDKIPGSIRFENEENPLMGYRSTRYMLGNTDIFSRQLRALLVASHYGKMNILMPMISTPEEVNLVLDEINLLKNDLAQEGVPFDPNVPIGVMLEVPSVLFMIGTISDDVDFFCVGANDLVQYLMAADRSNPRVARLYQWHHPTVLTALKHILDECTRNDQTRHHVRRNGQSSLGRHAPLRHGLRPHLRRRPFCPYHQMGPQSDLQRRHERPRRQDPPRPQLHRSHRNFLRNPAPNSKPMHPRSADISKRPSNASRLTLSGRLPLPQLGNSIRNVVPRPISDSSVSFPPCSSMVLWTTASPSPVPRLPFVEKNGSKIFA